MTNNFANEFKIIFSGFENEIVANDGFIFIFTCTGDIFVKSDKDVEGKEFLATWTHNWGQVGVGGVLHETPWKGIYSVEMCCNNHMDLYDEGGEINITIGISLNMPAAIGYKVKYVGRFQNGQRYKIVRC